MKKVALIFTMFLAFALMLSCTKDSAGGEGPEGTETGIGEGAEGSHNEGNGGEGSGGEGGNESGMLWNIDETADEIVNGIRLILAYDAASSSFVGTLENINTTTAPQVRVEVHVFDASGNSTEFGPTDPADMAPGAMRDVTLPITAGTSFVQFNMHPEVGGSGS